MDDLNTLPFPPPCGEGQGDTLTFPSPCGEGQGGGPQVTPEQRYTRRERMMDRDTPFEEVARSLVEWTT